MDRPADLHTHDAVEVDGVASETFEQELDRLIREDDGSAADEILASGQPIYISHDDTPADHVIRVHPNGREELIAVDWSDIARLLNQ